MPEADLWDWLMLDAAKTPLRLAAAGACLWAMRPRGARTWGWRESTGAGAAFAFCVFAAHAVSFWDGAGRGRWGFVLVGAVLTVPVAVWEELCYRGLLFGGLKETMAPLPAALASSAVFTVMHWGAIPVRGWGLVFLTGLGYCAAIETGAGLPALVLSHWAIDSVWFLAPAIPAGSPAQTLSMWLLMPAVGAWAVVALFRARRPAV